MKEVWFDLESMTVKQLMQLQRMATAAELHYDANDQETSADKMSELWYAASVEISIKETYGDALPAEKAMEKLNKASELIVEYIDEDFQLHLLEDALSLLEEAKKEIVGA